MRKFKLINNYYGELPYKLFAKRTVTIETGLTVLVGCNGAGKTTMLRQIEQSLSDDGIPYLYHSNLTFGEKEAKSEAAFYGDFRFVADILASSEGENIINIVAAIAKRMGQLSQRNTNAKELWFLFDAIDSGLSIDNIVEIKETLFKHVQEFEQGKDIYFVVSANEYEMARGERCFDVMHSKYRQFKTYDSFRKFVLKTRGEKDKRYVRD